MGIFGAEEGLEGEAAGLGGFCIGDAADCAEAEWQLAILRVTTAKHRARRCRDLKFFT